MKANIIESKIGLAGKFFLTFTNQKTGAIRNFEFDNLILDSGLDLYGSSASTSTAALFNGCAVGTDTSDPVASQTQMANLLAITTDRQSYGNAGSNTTTQPYWTKTQSTYRFGTGVGTGNISQVAMVFGANASNNTYSGIFSLVRIKDSNGNPITITKLADEVLDIRYELQMVLPIDDAVGVVTIGDQTYDYIMRPSRAASWNAGYPLLTGSGTANVYSGNIGDQLGYPTGSYVQTGVFWINPAQAGTFSATSSLIGNLDDSNISGGFRSVAISRYGHYWQCQYSNTVDGSKIPKDATKTMRLNFRFNFGRTNVIT